MVDLAEAFAEMRRLSANIDKGVAALTQHSVALAAAEEAYRKGKREAWARCPIDDPSVKAGEREWTAARREAWVQAETAELRHTRDEAEYMRDTAREALRSRRTQISALQTLLNAHEAEAEFVRTAPRAVA